MKIAKIIILLLLTASILGGCDSDGNLSNSEINKIEKSIKNIWGSFKEVSANDTPKIENTKQDKDLIGSETNSENYAFVNNNETTLNESDKKLLNQKGNNEFWAIYPDLDKYGRGGQVTALITNEAVQSHSSKAQERPAFDYGVHIAGEYQDGEFDAQKQAWKGENSNNQILQLEGYRGYIYNKSHSLAWSLGGDMETHNLTLGTRAQNVGTNKDSNGGGMGYSETQVRNAIYDNPEAKVYYQVTPVYKENELMPRGSHVRAYSTNDDGQTVNLNVWVSNTQKGLSIDYQNGTYNQI